MKKIFFSIFHIFFSFVHCADVNNFHLRSKTFSNLVDAVVKVADACFDNDVSIVNFILPESSESFSMRDFKDEFLMKTSTTTKFGIRQDSSAHIKTIRGRRKRNVIFIIDTFVSFLEIAEQITPKIFRFNGLYLIVLANGEIMEIEQIFKHLWTLQIYNANLMFEDKSGSVSVKTFQPFHNELCISTKPILINEFQGGKFANDVEDFFPDKMTDLHNCTIRFSIFHNTEPFVIPKRQPDGKFRHSGREIYIIEALSQSLNFRVNYSYIGNDIYSCGNLSVKGPLNTLQRGEADLSVSNWFLKLDCLAFFDATTSYTSEQIIFIIPAGRELTSFERLSYPFTWQLWILFALCFLVAYLVIFIIKRWSKVVQDFVFGTGVTRPYFNVFVGFIGGSQHILPRRNFARFLLVIFLIYSLVIRTLYQGAFFQQSSKQHKEIETIDEMVQDGFTFYTIHGYSELFMNSELIKNRSTGFQILFIRQQSLDFRSVGVTPTEREFYLKKIRNDPTFKGAMGRPLMKVLYTNQISPRAAWDKICQQIFMTVSVVILTKKDFYLLDAVNDKIELFKAAGLIDHFHWRDVDKGLLSEKLQSYPKALALHHLMGCFHILWFGCLISFIIFVVELLLLNLLKV